MAKNDGQFTYFEWKDCDGENVVDLTGDIRALARASLGEMQVVGPADD